MKNMKTVSAKGLELPILGQGGWTIGDNPAKAAEEKAALRRGVALGMTLIDTAEMYGEGASEVLIGEALANISRGSYQLVSKVYPHNAGRETIFRSCDASLRRLQTDYLDIYLLHWRGAVPLAETVDCLEELVQAGKIRRWGVSNFDTADMAELFTLPNGKNCAVNQVLYNMGSRGIEYDLLPFMREHDVPLMAYCPLAQAGRLYRMNRDFSVNKTLLRVAKSYGISIMQLLLAFVLKQDTAIAIPKAGSVMHIEDNFRMLSIRISDEDWAEIDTVFCPPTTKMHLDME